MTNSQAENNTEKPKLIALSFRTTPEQRARLEAEAGSLSLNVYVLSRLFGENATKPRPVRRVTQDKKALAQVLAKLGQLQLSSDFNALAKTAKIGALPVTEDTEQRIVHACRDVRQIKGLLMKALGIVER